MVNQTLLQTTYVMTLLLPQTAQIPLSRGSPSNLDKGPCDSDGDVDSIVANSDSDRSGVSDANSTLSDDE